MERLSTTQPTGAGSQEGNSCISLCYQPVNVQTVENQTAVAVQSLIESQGIQEPQDEEDDIFQCGKCKKQFTSIQLFLSHKQTQCLLQQQQQQHQQPPQQVAPQQQQLQQQQQQQQQSLALAAGNGIFTTSTLNIGRSFGQNQINNSNNTNSNAPLLQAHPVLSRSLNQPTNGQTLTLGGLPPSPISQLPQNMIFTGDDLMALANLDTSGLNTPIQMVTGTVPPSNSSAVTILSPIGGLTASPNNFTNPAGAPTGSAGQLLVQPTQQITLTAISDKGMGHPHPSSVISHQVHQSQHMPPPVAPPPQSIVFPAVQQHQQQQQAVQALGQPQAQQQLQLQQLQQQIFKPCPTKAGRKSAQNLITVMNADNNNSSVSLLSTRKGKTARNATGNKNINNNGGQEIIDVEALPAKPKLRCEYCSKTFSKNFDLLQHIRAHTGEKPFQCIVCGRAFAQKSNVKKHMATHKVWPCGISNTLPKQPKPVLDEEDDANNDDNNVSDATTTTTSPAGTSFMIPATDSPIEHDGMDGDMAGQNGMTEQDKKMASELGEDGDKDGKKMKVVVDNSYICQYCPAKFKTYYQLKTHLVKHKDEQVYKCMMKTCGEAFHELDSFLKHVKTHENEMTYRCHKCHKYFPSLYDLGVHQFTHSLYPSQTLKSGPRHFQCTKCGNKYTTPEALEHHLSTTSHEYKCPHCEKQFTCERFLRRHLPIHGSDGQFECTFCQKKFKTEHYLKTHILIHTGETPFSCHLCQAMFNRKDKLKRHMTIHDTVKKYRCPFRNVAGCTKEFNRPDKLKAHIITHSGIKPHKCSICNKGFSRKPHLIEHERGHRADYKYKCEKCGKGFFRPKLFKEHKCSNMITEQIFRPKNKRKIGRPKKRMVTITADSIAKCRGKQYVSRTRGKEKSGQAVSGMKQETANPTVGNVNSGLKRNPSSSSSSSSLSSLSCKGAEVAKPDQKGESQIKLQQPPSPSSSSSSAMPGVFDDEPKTVSVELVKALPLMTTGADCTGGLIDLDATGIGVDHYVVHLAESIDGGSSVQTAFIPAVSGNQIFAAAAATPGSVGIQPITIIEAAAQAGDTRVGQISSIATSTNDLSLSNPFMVDAHGGNQDGQPNMVLALAKTSHDLSSLGNISLTDKNGKMVAMESLLQDVSGHDKTLPSPVSVMGQNPSSILIRDQSGASLLDSTGHHHRDSMIRGKGGVGGVSINVDGFSQCVNVGDLNGMKDGVGVHGNSQGGNGNVIVIKNEGLVGGNGSGSAVVSAIDLEGAGGGDLMDMSGPLTLFQAAAGPPGSGPGGLVDVGQVGQVVVSGTQTFLACPPTLVDYSGDGVYNKSPI